jgi:hypothetical protein
MSTDVLLAKYFSKAQHREKRSNFSDVSFAKTILNDSGEEIKLMHQGIILPGGAQQPIMIG